MEFRILGPVGGSQDGTPLRLGGPRQCALLAYLLLHANETVSMERLLDELWWEPPGGGVSALQTQLSRLRKVVADRLIRSPAGYSISVTPGELDLHRFRALLEDVGTEGEPHARRRLLLEAESLWCGEPLAGLDFPFVARERAALEELHVAVIEERVGAELEVGNDSRLIAELSALSARHPLREKLRAQLMLALYRAGRQTDALDVYRDARQTLDEELGLQPGPELRELERAILRHDPSLERRTTSVVGRRPARRAMAVVSVALAAIAATAAAVAVFGTAPSHPARRAASRPPPPWTTLTDQFAGNRLDDSTWGTNMSGTGAALHVRKGRLWLVLPALGRIGGHYNQISAGIFSMCRFNGDFDTRVNYQLVLWPASNGARAQLSAWIFPSSNSDAARESAAYGERYDGDMPTADKVIGTPDRSGTLRVLRRNGKMEALIRRHGRWVVLVSERVAGQVMIGIQLFATSTWSHRTVEAAFDNFRVSAPSMLCA